MAPSHVTMTSTCLQLALAAAALGLLVLPRISLIEQHSEWRLTSITLKLIWGNMQFFCLIDSHESNFQFSDDLQFFLFDPSILCEFLVTVEVKILASEGDMQWIWAIELREWCWRWEREDDGGGGGLTDTIGNEK
ncbi:hypothetical protein L1987_25140 [Smallanthus sonchifolius]|uniref:Uncharacterized protein n=1 Tax=Smallanthus sonchifolius TaxID=185202 RepID=A0ACB9INU2_9ASTR|nr:hypothetical protein L1987_25140 [Smallanthus sonchifolius]